MEKFENKAELNKTVNQCLEVINKDDDIMQNEVKKEWKKAFLTSQNDWADKSFCVLII